MKTISDYIQYVINEANDNYSEYLKKRADIADKYDHENGPEMNKKMDELEKKEYAALDKKYPEAAKRFNSEQLAKQKGKLAQRKLVRHNITKHLSAEYLKELAKLEEKYDHEFGSFEKNKQMDDEYNEKLAELKKKYNIK